MLSLLSALIQQLEAIIVNAAMTEAIILTTHHFVASSRTSKIEMQEPGGTVVGNCFHNHIWTPPLP
jgi:hypothetical protein